MDQQSKRSRKTCIYCNEDFSDRHFRRHVNFVECKKSVTNDLNDRLSICNTQNAAVGCDANENDTSEDYLHQDFISDDEQPIDYDKYFSGKKKLFRM